MDETNKIALNLKAVYFCSEREIKNIKKKKTGNCQNLKISF